MPESLYDRRTLDFIFPGADIPLFQEQQSLSPADNSILEGDQLVAAGLDIATNIFNKRWFGPFPADALNLAIHKLDGSVKYCKPRFLPYFLIQKKDVTKWRWISDAKRPLPN